MPLKIWSKYHSILFYCLWIYILRSWIVGLYSSIFFKFWKVPYCFHSNCPNLHFLPTVQEGALFSTSSATVISSSFGDSHPNRYEVWGDLLPLMLFAAALDQQTRWEHRQVSIQGEQIKETWRICWNIIHWWEKVYPAICNNHEKGNFCHLQQHGSTLRALR